MKKIIFSFLVLFSWVKGGTVEFTVTTTNDSVDANLADGLCLDSNGECSLRAAVMQSNILGTVDVIYLVRGESYILSLNNDIDTQAANDLDIFDSLTISIANPNLPIESLAEMPAIGIDDIIEDRVFEIHAGELISFKGIFISQGDATNSLSNQGQGGGIYVSEQVTEFRIADSIVAFNRARYGAGIYSRASVTWIDKTDISYNTLKSPAFIFSIAGAAVYHKGMQLTLNKSVIHHNFAEDIGTFSTALYFAGANSEVSILNTLVADNGEWSSPSGVMGGILSSETDLRVNNSNITGNTGVGISFSSDDKQNEHTLVLRNSVLAFNVLDDCGDLTGVQNFGSPFDYAHIIASDLSCSLSELARNLQGVDPNLSVLEGRFQTFNFQFFSTQYPMDDSVLIDAGSLLDVNSENISACETTDIRGVTRPMPSNGGEFNNCDVGVYELNDQIYRNGFEPIED